MHARRSKGIWRAGAVVLGVGCASLLLTASSARAVVLYDGALNTSPEAQGWLTYFPPIGTKTTAGGKTTLDSGAMGNQVGFSNYVPLPSPALVNAGFPALDRASGFTVNLTAKLNGETHASNDRAGLSLIVLSSDHQGVELGFWPNEVWAQSGAAFTHAEGAAVDTTAALTQYQLTVHGASYSLAANGSPLLSGAVRDYSSFGVPYSLNNYLFVGDDTTSATASFDISHLEVAVPEPTGMGVALLSMVVMRRARAQRHMGILPM